MKKLFYISVVLLGLMACSTDEKPENPTDITTEYQLELIIARILNEYGNYDSQKVAETLDGKEFGLWSYLEYNPSWDKVISTIFVSGEAQWEGTAPDYYTFSSDGTVSRYYTLTALGPTNDKFIAEGTWSFDTDSSVLSTTLTYEEDETREYTLRALGDELFVWNEVKYDTMKGKLRYFRSVYKIKSGT